MVKSATTQDKLTKQVKTIIAEHIGVEVEDLNNDDSLREDLHMNANDLVDLVHSLSEINLDTSKVDLMEVDTIENLIDRIGSDEYF